MFIDFDRSKSLQELEGEDWGESRSEIAWSNLVQRVYKMRRVPVEELTIDNIRTLLGQDLSLGYVMPLAIEQLQKDPWAPSNSYAGGVIRSMLYDPEGRKAQFWQQHPELWTVMREVLQQALDLLPTLDELSYSWVHKRSTIGPNPHLRWWSRLERR